jgi:hypothetical protein
MSYIIKDAEATQRGHRAYTTLDEALVGLGNHVDTSPELYPQEFPFNIIDNSTGRIVLLLDLPK